MGYNEYRLKCNGSVCAVVCIEAVLTGAPAEAAETMPKEGRTER
nr:hypothetical protein [Mediterraneibacter glycyrrhizinilyticus]